MVIQRDGKTVAVWLTRADQENSEIKAQLAQLYRESKCKGQLVAVFQSGTGDLFRQTSDLLCYNRERIAQLAVQREKEQRTAT